jgi:hypothetical protein
MTSRGKTPSLCNTTTEPQLEQINGNDAFSEMGLEQAGQAAWAGFIEG